MSQTHGGYGLDDRGYGANISQSDTRLIGVMTSPQHDLVIVWPRHDPHPVALNGIRGMSVLISIEALAPATHLCSLGVVVVYKIQAYLSLLSGKMKYEISMGIAATNHGGQSRSNSQTHVVPSKSNR